MTVQKGDFLMNAVAVKNLTKVFRQGDEDIYAVDHVRSNHAVSLS